MNKPQDKLYGQPRDESGPHTSDVPYVGKSENLLAFQPSEKCLYSATDEPIPHVNAVTAQFHLSLLRRFCALYSAVEGVSNDQKSKTLAVRKFLVCAESRYIDYLSLVEKFAANIALPLERECTTDEVIHQFNQTMPLPPWDVSLIFHSHCLSPSQFFADVLRRKQFKDKGLAFPVERLHSLISSGTWSDVHSETVWNDTFSCAYQLWDQDPDQGGVLNLQSVGMKRSWYDSHAIPSTSCHLRHWSDYADRLSLQSPKTEFYDVVTASLRQREFAINITGQACRGLNSPSALRNAVTRYHMFMLLMKPLPASTNTTLVPTWDIDLCWHTHQLFPGAYRSWCTVNLRRLINHDDTIRRSTAVKGLRETSLLWVKAYHKGYTTDDLKKEYFSTWRTVAGIIFPPYGLLMILKGHQLKQAKLRGSCRVSNCDTEGGSGGDSCRASS
jgi:hypothetical protein